MRARKVSLRAAILLLVAHLAAKATADECSQLAVPAASHSYAVQASSDHVRRTMAPEFFGFNLLRMAFQRSAWDATRRQVLPEVTQWMKAFPGAVYRFPGGHEANFTDWHNTIGAFGARLSEKTVDWLGPLPVEFGLPEYLDFVQAVGGQPWYVLNLFGSYGEELPATKMAQEAANLASRWRELNTHGAPLPLRWELGNELDRDRFRWSPAHYAATARLVMDAVATRLPEARFVAMSQDWNASSERWGIAAMAYNRYLGTALRDRTDEYAVHLYYDNLPWGLPIPQEINHYCRNHRDLASAPGTPQIWITEHGRTPAGTPADPIPKNNWPQTADMNAAISVADMVIASTQLPGVKGMFVHGLHASKGPWPLLNKQADGKIVPSPVYWGLRMLREAMLDEALATRVESANQSHYDGGYDLRAVVLANKPRTQYALWMINRAPVDLQISLQVQSLANLRVSAEIVWLNSEHGTDNNYAGANVRPQQAARTLQFDTNGRSALAVPRLSVVTLVISLPQVSQ